MGARGGSPASRLYAADTMGTRLHKDSTRLLFLFLCIEGALIVLQLIAEFPPAGVEYPDSFSINIDRGLAESIRYIAELWIAVLFIVLAYRKKEYAFLFWTALFSLLLLDDSMSFHELYAMDVYSQLGLIDHGVSEAWGQSAGEVIVIFTVGLMLLPFVLLLLFKGSAEFKKVSRNVLALMALTAFFAIGVDAGRGAVEHELLAPILELLEGAGEFTGITLILWYVFRLTGEGGNNHQPGL